jgi:sugar phosphate isomerase/epimerase
MIALQLYTIRDRLQDRARLPGVLDRVREIGYTAVEVAGLPQDAIAQFGDELRRAGLVACAAHVGIDRLTRDLQGVVAECRDWGCQYVVVPSMPEEFRTHEGWPRFAALVGSIAGRLGHDGFELAYHNHAFELERFGEGTRLDQIVDGGPLQTEPDTYWLQYGGVNPAAWIRRHAGRVPLVHLKDFAVERGVPFDAEVGEGNLDWQDILSACREAGTRWLIVEQDAPRRDPMESVAISFQNLTRLVADA